MINIALDRKRTVFMLLTLILCWGAYAFWTIPKESTPDVTTPFIHITLMHEGISADDADRLLVRPVVQQLQDLSGVKEITSTASRNTASVQLEFLVGTDIDLALIDVRDKVDRAKAELPDTAEEPLVYEINLAEMPVLVAAISGNVDDRLLFNIADRAKDLVESIPGVLEAELKGNREALAEIVIDPVLMESYRIDTRAVYDLLSRNNQLIAAGALDNGRGRFPVTLPGLIEDVEDLLELPIKVTDDRVVLFKDIATARRTFKDASSLARINGQATVTLNVKKRIGANVIDTVQQVKTTLSNAESLWPDNISIRFTQDQSIDIQEMLNDLMNSVLFATLLVMFVIVVSLGARSAFMVGIVIPGSFLSAILFIQWSGYTLNMVVLFSLMLAVGMLVDGAIVVNEYADRKMVEGQHRRAAYQEATQRMAWPIIASTATTLAVFMPLLFWPGTTGDFMKYLPLTLIYTLSASLVMALVVLPTLGSVLGKARRFSERAEHNLVATESGDLNTISGITGWYIKVLTRALKAPWITLFLTILTLIGSIVIYSFFGRGVEFFPTVENNYATVLVRARGDMSLLERDALVRDVESIILEFKEIKSAYTTVTTGGERGNNPRDTIGVIQLELEPWYARRNQFVILQDIRDRTAHLSGIIVEAQALKDGPSQGRDIQLRLSSHDHEALLDAVNTTRSVMDNHAALMDIQDGRPLDGIEWRITIDRAEAARYGVDVSLVGSSVQLLTNGLMVSSYRPDDTTDNVDIRVRYPHSARHIEQLDRLRVTVNGESIPIRYFVSMTPEATVGDINRTNGLLSYMVEANVRSGEQVNAILPDLMSAIVPQLPADVFPELKGDQEQQADSGNFLVQAFAVAIFIMAVILVTQFNSFYQASLILSAVLLSTIGVLLGLLIRGEAFSIVMSGVGIISLAGIVVNNNIVLIDTYNSMRKKGLDAHEAALRTGAQRLRPVILTTVTTCLGLIPMVTETNIDLMGFTMSFGAPSSQWWTQLSTAIAGGLLFATVLTLILTPCLLILGPDRYRHHINAANKSNDIDDATIPILNPVIAPDQ